MRSIFFGQVFGSLEDYKVEGTEGEHCRGDTLASEDVIRVTHAERVYCLSLCSLCAIPIVGACTSGERHLILRQYQQDTATYTWRITHVL